MLIVFDLDDTLIETTEGVFPEALSCIDEPPLRQILSETARYFPSSREGIQEILEIMGRSSHQKEVYQAIERAVGALSRIECPSGVLETLEHLFSHHQMGIVTRGSREKQLLKIEKAHLPVYFFSFIHTTEGGKGPIYQEILQQTPFRPDEIIVCGDRIDLDLQPAKALGMRTVHIRHGRGRGNTGRKKDVDYTIVDIRQLLELAPLHI